MGGNVFKNEYDVVRLDANQYKNIGNIFCGEFGAVVSLYKDNYHPYTIIPSYRKKDSFGDMDVIFTGEKLSNDLLDILVIQMGIIPEKICRNGNVTSFLYNPLGYGDFQVDMIYMDHSNYESALDYYSYNDLGNLRGRIAHMLGLKLGHNGLSYIHRDENHVCFEINLSKNWSRIDSFLGFPGNATEKMIFDGPDTLEDIFEYIASSKYFNPDIFLLENRNHISRTRDKKRKTYTEFLAWCEKLPKKDYFQKPEKNTWQTYAMSYFNCTDDFNDLLNAYNARKAVRSKLNGHLVMERTKLQGKHLGSFMVFLKEHISDDLILILSSETIGHMIDDLFEVYKGVYGVTQ